MYHIYIIILGNALMFYLGDGFHYYKQKKENNGSRN
jgi:hypothetical protein